MTQKVNKKELQESQTEQSPLLHQEIVTHPSRGLTPAQLSKILQDAEQGNLIAQAALFQDMEEKDGHIQAEMHKRKMAVIGLDWSLIPPHNASEAERAATALLEARIRDMLDVEDMLFDALDAIGHGYSCLELEWKQDNIGWFPEVHHRIPSWFTIDPQHPNHLRLRSPGNLYGDELRDLGWLVHEHKSRSGHLVRTGLHRALAWPYLFKNYSVRDLAEFLEIYGLPIRIGKYAPGASDAEKRTLMQAVMGIGHNAGGIIPQSMQMDFITSAAAGGSDPFKAMIDWCEATQSKVILGGTLTSSIGSNGNRSLGEVHNEVRLDIRNSDARQLATTLSGYLVYPVAMLNGLFADNRCPTWQFDTQEVDDLAQYADALPKLALAGMQIPLSYIHDKLRIPAAENNEPVLRGAAASSVTPLAATSRPKFTPDQQAIEDLADAMPLKSPIDRMAVASAIRAASSPDDLEQRLARVLAEADLSEFSEQLEKALFAADIMGYANAE
ncbi:MAG: DUF935 domain-containing protein [Methyloprofundus sp.]|nr:DUF935 domain-containing protein [Methyloprofundus sp.]